MSDTTYWKGGIQVMPIDELCNCLRQKFKDEDEELERIKEENQKLKDDVWEKEEIARLKKEVERLKKKMAKGFFMSEEEWGKVKEWQKVRRTYVGASGGQFIYTFHPTGIGDIIKVRDCIHEEELIVRDI